MLYNYNNIIFSIGILDQMRYDNVLRYLYENGPADHYEFRFLIANSLQENVDNGHILWDNQIRGL